MKMRLTSSLNNDIQAACESASRALTDARLNVAALKAFPGQLPDTMEQAYAIQSASIDSWNDRVAGWKVAMMPVSHRAIWDTDRLCGPIFADSVISTPDCVPVSVPIFPAGFAAVEAEFVLVMGHTVLPQQRTYTNEELTELVQSMHIGVEIAGSPLATINQIGPAAVISDFGNNAGLVFGPLIKDGLSKALDTLHVNVEIDQKTVGEATAASIPGGPLQALRFLLDICAARNITVSKGELISTGAVTGVHEVNSNAQSRIHFEGVGQLDLTFVTIQPHHVPN